MGVRRKGRELALQALYQCEIREDTSERALREFWDSFGDSEEAREFADGLVHGVLERQAELDRLLEGALQHWRRERLSKVDVNVVRIALYEMTATPPLPVEIAINEAIEIARRFGTRQSAAFVNGVLDELAARLGLGYRKQEGSVQRDG